MIYYTFVSLQYSTAIQANMESSAVLENIFMQASIILILFVSVFIWYSNSFFIRKRKKEVGLYSLLGVRKRMIGKMLFYENLLVGMIALAGGVMVGTLLSKFFSMILMQLMGISADIGMTFSLKAVLNTTFVFLVISLFTSIQGYRLIYRFQLVELFQAEKEGEQVPKASYVTAGFGVALLGFCYWLLYVPTPSSEVQSLINVTMMTVSLVAGTYLLFRFATIALLRLLQKVKSHYYKGMNLVSISQLLYRVKGNALTLTIIAILSAVTISVLATAYTNYYLYEKSINRSIPFSYQHLSQGEAFDNQVAQIIKADKEHPIQAQLDVPVIEVKADFHAPRNYLTDPTRIISETTFNQVATALNRDDGITLVNTEAAVIKPLYAATEHNISDYKEKEITLHLPNEEMKLTFIEMKEGKVLRWGYPDFYIIVSEEMFEHLAKQVQPLTYKVYKVENEKATKETSEQLLQLQDAPDAQMMTVYKQYKNGLESAGLDLFLLGFSGLVFLVATGSIIYFKQLTEAYADQKRYKILRKIGVSKVEIRSAILKQTLFVFALPLVVGVCHSIVILQALSALYGATEYNVVMPIVSTIMVYIVIYFGYFVLTVRTSNRIVDG